MKKTTNEIFKEWIDKTPICDYQSRLQQLSEYCGVTKAVIGFWKSGRTQIKPAYQKLINDFAGKKIFNQ
jgi:hypothetical protein